MKIPKIIATKTDLSNLARDLDPPAACQLLDELSMTEIERLELEADELELLNRMVDDRLAAAAKCENEITALSDAIAQAHDQLHVMDVDQDERYKRLLLVQRALAERPEEAIANLTGRANDIKAQLESLETEKNRLALAADDERATISRHRAALESLTDRIRKKGTEAHRLATELDRQQGLIGEEKERLPTLKKDIRELEEEIRTQALKRRDLVTEITSAEQRLEKLKPEE